MVLMAMRLSRALNVSDRVDFVGEQEQVVPLLSVADVFLLPSSQESFGLAALEAMACDVPVVASNIGGLPELMVDLVAALGEQTVEIGARRRPAACALAVGA